MTPAQLVTSQFPGKLFIPMIDAGSALGIAKQTCYNLRSKGCFPLPIHKNGSRNVVAVTDVIAYLDEKCPAVKVAVQHTAEKRKRGRPTKAEQMKQRAGW